MTEIAFARATAHRDQLRTTTGRTQVRADLRRALSVLGSIEGFRRFHVERSDDLFMAPLLTDELRDAGYVVVLATADVTP